MSNETKQPTLPEAIALAREALTNCEGMIDELRDYPVTHDSIIEALAALEAELKDRDDWITCHAKIFRKLQEANNTIAQQAKRIKELETKLTLFVSRG